MLAAVISPPKTERLLTSAEALADAADPVTADALAFAEPLLTIGPSLFGSSPYEKLPLNWTESFGALTVGVAAPGWPGTTTRMA